MKLIKAIYRTPVLTWAGHSYMAVIPPLVVATALGLAGWLTEPLHRQLCYLGLVVAMGLFYAFREAGDEARHRYVTKDYDKPQANTTGLTSRVDKIGDSLGPFVAATVTTATVLVGYAPWFCLPLVLGATYGLLRAARRHA